MPAPRIGLAITLGLALLLVACGAPQPTASPSARSSVPSTTPSATPGPGQVIAAPGSSSTVYKPNPGAVVVAIDPGHGGCLDWGVPNPHDNKVANAEKTLTLGIGMALKELLEAQGITVVMTRQTDAALAGDDYPQLGCTGPPFRDVNGDGLAGFGPKFPVATRTRDELSARIDLANLARADLFVSIHINSLVQDNVAFDIAASQTIYTDAFPWAPASKRLADEVQAGVVRSMAAVATGYRRQDRGADGAAPYLYLLKPAGSDPMSPRRALQMPAILSEVGSISLSAEAALLATPAGQRAAAGGVFDGIRAYLAQRPVAARLEASIPGGSAGQAPTASPGDGPPFWPAVLPAAQGGSYHLTVRLTNTGTAAWPSGMKLVAGWSASAQPYLATAPADLGPVASTVPNLAPGESVELPVALAASQGDGRQVTWLTLQAPDGTPLTDLGVPPLELAASGP